MSNCFIQAREALRLRVSLRRSREKRPGTLISRRQGAEKTISRGLGPGAFMAHFAQSPTGFDPHFASLEIAHVNLGGVRQAFDVVRFVVSTGSSLRFMLETGIIEREFVSVKNVEDSE